MTNWDSLGSFFIKKEWQFSQPISSNAIRFKSLIFGNPPPPYLSVKGLLALVRFENDSLSNPLFLYPSQVIYPFVTEPQLVIFPWTDLSGVYRLGTKLSSGNLLGNTWSLDVWEYSQSVVSPSTITSESLTAIQQLFINNPVNLSTEAIIQIAETINQQNLEYYPPG